MCRVRVHRVHRCTIRPERLQQRKPTFQAGGAHDFQLALGGAAKIHASQMQQARPSHIQEGERARPVGEHLHPDEHGVVRLHRVVVGEAPRQA